MLNSLFAVQTKLIRPFGINYQALSGLSFFSHTEYWAVPILTPVYSCISGLSSTGSGFSANYQCCVENDDYILCISFLQRVNVPIGSVVSSGQIIAYSGFTVSGMLPCVRVSMFDKALNDFIPPSSVIDFNKPLTI